MKRVIVIGGGLSGLAAAYRLQRSAEADRFPLSVTLVEASDRLAGIIGSVRRDGYLLESGPDCFITEKPRGLELCRELGLQDEIIGTQDTHRRSFIVKGGRLLPIPQAFYLIAPSSLRPFLASSLISWPGKFRAMLEPLMKSRSPSDESLGSFVRRRLGREVLERLAQPLVAGIYGADPDHLSLRATFPQFLEMEKTYGSVILGLQKRAQTLKDTSGARYGLFASLQGGMQRLTDRLAERITTNAVRKGAAVERLERDGAQWVVHLKSGDALAADAVCLALPAPAIGRLLESHEPELAGRLRAIRYGHSAILTFAFREKDIRHPLDGFGFVVPAIERSPLMACTFAHRKFAGRAPKGFALLRAFLAPTAELTSEKQAVRSTLAELKKLLGVGDPAFFDFRQWFGALPHYAVGHLTEIARIEEESLRLPGIFLAGNWGRGVGVPDVIASGERAAADALTFLKKLA